MFEIRNSIHILIVFYIVICLGIWYMKPSSMFNDKGLNRQVRKR